MDLVAGTRGEACLPACLPATGKTTVFGNHSWRCYAAEFYSWDSFRRAWERMVDISVIWPMWCHLVARAQRVHKSLSLEILFLHQFLTFRNSKYFYFYTSSENSLTSFLHSYFIITLFQTYSIHMHSMNKPASKVSTGVGLVTSSKNGRSDCGGTIRSDFIWVLRPNSSF